MASETLEVKPVHFFKIILTQTLHQGKLMMPRKFVEKYGEGLSKAIYLKTPNGGKWKLNLVKSDDGKIWFEKGWKEFAEYHSLAHGHLLLFKYQSSSHFLVCIFEKNALEINYPLQRVAAEKVSNGQGNKPSNGENCRAAQKRKANSSFEFHQPREIGSGSCVKGGKLQRVATLHHTDREFKGKQVITANTTLERAKSFKTSNPSFVVVMRPSYVGRKFALSIPRMFGKTHFDLENKRGDIYFQVLNGRVWPARYSIWINFSHGPKKFELTSGWKEFAMANNLKVGDVCKFELISCTSLTFNVHIFRETDNDNSNCSTSQKSIQMKEEDTQG